jgi:nitrogen regulatory protein P-II 1
MKIEDKKNMMTKLEVIIQPSRFEAVKEVLTELGIGGMTISDVRGHGRQKGTRKFTKAANTRSISFPRSSLRLLCLMIWSIPPSERF